MLNISQFLFVELKIIVAKRKLVIRGRISEFYIYYFDLIDCNFYLFIIQNILELLEIYFKNQIKYNYKCQYSQQIN